MSESITYNPTEELRDPLLDKKYDTKIQEKKARLEQLLANIKANRLNKSDGVKKDERRTALNELLSRIKENRLNKPVEAGANYIIESEKIGNEIFSIIKLIPESLEYTDKKAYEEIFTIVSNIEHGLEKMVSSSGRREQAKIFEGMQQNIERLIELTDVYRISLEDGLENEQDQKAA